MKKLLLFVSLAGMTLFAASCIEPVGEETPQEITQPGETVFTATMAEPSTKVQLNEDATGLHVLWSPGDVIALFHSGRNKADTFTTPQSMVEPAATTEFTGELTPVETPTDPYFYAIFPKHGSADKFENGHIVPQLNSSQFNAKPGTFSYNQSTSGSGAVFVGRSLTHSIKFYNVCSFLRFKVTENSFIYRIDFTGKNEEVICGAFEVDFNNNNIPESISPRGTFEEKGTVRLMPDGGGYFKKDEWYYLTLLPTSFTKGAKITLYSETGGKITRTIKGTEQSPLTFDMNECRSISSIDGGKDFPGANISLSLFQNDTEISETTLWPRGTTKLTAIMHGYGDREVSGLVWTWSSDDENIATVSDDGVITGIAAGQQPATITATTICDSVEYSVSCTVTVTEAASQLVARPFTVDDKGTLDTSDDIQVYFAPGNLYTSDGGTTFGFNTYQGQLRDTTGWKKNNVPSTRDLLKWSEIATNEGDAIISSWSSGSFPGYGAFDSYDWPNPKTFTINGDIWLPLTFAQWYYLINHNGGFARATVNGINGLILLPNDFNSGDITITTGANTTYTSNVYYGETWTSLEECGAIFLPEAGNRRDDNGKPNSGGYYWSRSLKNSSDGGGLRLNFGDKMLGGTNLSGWFASVRLVRVVENTN